MIGLKNLSKWHFGRVRAAMRKLRFDVFAFQGEFLNYGGTYKYLELTHKLSWAEKEFQLNPNKTNENRVKRIKRELNELNKEN